MTLLQYSTLYIIILTAVVVTIPVLCGVQVIPERVKVVYMNEKYLYNYTFVIKRYSRRGPYCLNAEATLKHEWNNNVTINLIFNEFLHNEYRRSFIELHYKYCDLLKNEKYLGASIAAYGIKCPMAAGTYRFMNFTTPMEKFPNVFPYEYARVDIEVTVTATSESIVKIYFYAHFKNMVHKH
ncbi:unnamed protein product, partial [Brenthis ino]